MLIEIVDRRRTPEPVYRSPRRIVTLTFAGDIMAHDVNYYRPAYEEIYREVVPFLRSDWISFANLEFPVDPDKPYSNYPAFNNHPGYVEAAIEAGFDVFSAANNHAADQGADSILATRRVLEDFAGTRDIYWSGLRAHPDDPMMPVLIEREDLRIGFLAVTFFLNNDEGGEFVYRLDYRDRERREAFLAFLRSVTPAYDLFVLSVHGGVEYRKLPLPQKYAFFHQLIEAGTDVLWGHHPHVLQPHETVRLSDGRRALIINSAGNFISGQTWHMEPSEEAGEHPARGESALYRVRLLLPDEGGSRICGLEVVPIVTFKDPVKGMVVRLHKGLVEKPGTAGRWGEFYRRRAALVQRSLTPFDFHNISP